MPAVNWRASCWYSGEVSSGLSSGLGEVAGKVQGWAGVKWSLLYYHFNTSYQPEGWASTTRLRPWALAS